MKKRLLLLGLLFSPLLMNAQDVQVVESETVVGYIPQQDQEPSNRLVRYNRNRFGDNWFISIGGGGQMFFGPGDKYGGMKKRIAPEVDLSFGKWFNPYFGLRIQANGFQFKGYGYSNNAYIGHMVDPQLGLYSKLFYYMNVHADFMMDLFSLVDGYRPNRVYDIVPTFGVGYAHAFGGPKKNAVTGNVGLIHRFHVTRNFDINIEMRGALIPRGFDGSPIAGHAKVNGMLSASAGFTFYINNKKFKRANPVVSDLYNYEVAVMNCQEQLAQSNAMVGQLAGQLECCQNAADSLAQLANRPVMVPVAEPVSSPLVLFFKINSAEINAKNMINIESISNEMKKFPDRKYTIIGYADKATGTPAFNKQLSEKRAQAVYDVLVNKFGVKSSQLKTVGEGGQSMFAKPYLNRAVVIE